MSQFSKLSMPELYLACAEREIKGYFPKEKEEVVKLLEQYEEKHNTEPEGEVMSKKVNEDLEPDDLELDDLELDEEELEVEEEAEAEPEVEAEAEPEVEITEEEIEEISSDDLELDDLELDEEIPEAKPEKKEKKEVAKKKEAKKVTKKVAKKATKKVAKKVEKKEAVKKAVGTADNPFKEGSAGAYVFTAMTKGGTLDAVVKRADAAIEKAGAKPPAKTIQKVKILIAEINSGKRGDFGKFELSDKGKLTYTK